MIGGIKGNTAAVKHIPRLGGELADGALVAHQSIAAPFFVGTDHGIVNDIAAAETAVVGNIEHIAFTAVFSPFERGTGAAVDHFVAFDQTLVAGSCQLDARACHTEHLVVEDLTVSDISVKHDPASPAENGVVADRHMLRRGIDTDILPRKKSHVEIFPDDMASEDHHAFVKKVKSFFIAVERQESAVGAVEAG